MMKLSLITILSLAASVAARPEDILADVPKMASACQMLKEEDTEAIGLCNAYEKKNCDTEETPSCAKIAENFERITGSPLAEEGGCPCWTQEEYDSVIVPAFSHVLLSPLVVTIVGATDAGMFQEICCM